MGDKWRQDPREGGRAIQQRETRRGTMGDKGVQDPQDGGHTIQQRETRRGTVGDKGREDPREGGHTIQQRETRRGRMGDKGRQDPREGGYTIQHQGGHLKIALRIPNSTLFREKRWSNFGHKRPCHLQHLQNILLPREHLGLTGMSNSGYPTPISKKHNKSIY